MFFEKNPAKSLAGTEIHGTFAARLKTQANRSLSCRRKKFNFFSKKVWRLKKVSTFATRFENEASFIDHRKKEKIKIFLKKFADQKKLLLLSPALNGTVHYQD